MAGDLHIGLAGAGRIGALHAATLQSLARVGALTVYDADPARAQALGTATATTAEELAAAVDALVIATPSAAHVALVRLAVEAGLPAFCEKPVALDPQTLDTLMAEVDRAGTLVQVGFQRRFDPGYLAAREAVRDGTVGTLLALRAATHDPAPPTEAYIATSGGIFQDLHIHDFDAIRFVTGVEIAEVYADGSVRESRWFEAAGDVDTAAALIRLEDGVLAVVTGTRHDPRGYDVRLEVFGTRDSVAVGLEPRMALRSVEPGTAPPAEGYRSFVERFGGAYRAELAAFVEAVRDGRPSPCPLAEARAALVAAVAADRSRAERRPVATSEITAAG
jgi:myo-inositol 2-dehydrogenase/D-chiro-inositol 1-dehydrogenase